MGARTPASASADYAYDSHWGSVGAGNGQFSGTLSFSGKLGGRTLRAGVYRATALAANTGAKSSPATTKFTVAP